MGVAGLARFPSMGVGRQRQVSEGVVRLIVVSRNAWRLPVVQIVVYGAGRLGQAVIAAAKAAGCGIVAVDRHLLESGGGDAVGAPMFATLEEAAQQTSPDVIVDASRADALDEVLEFAVGSGTGLVIAATGHDEGQVAKMKEAAKVIPLLRSSNLSVGVNVLRRLASDAARMLGPVDTEIVEAHHRLKVDAPSGTALTLAEAVRDAVDVDREFVYGRSPSDHGARGNEIGIHAVRGGTVVGEHTVTFLLDDEIVELRHVAQSRGVFGFGAVKAARFVKGAQPGLYTMEDLLG
ncbi:4-hydroxy-tetrahydrodipicolinate reductase [Schaalia sp. JY-X169]|uniref:4-hydroxy-tetrahydrodipicolinate reductase n=1 Tax=Schaalia sp. JY-X169 TaxID=2758572 RepID=UPI0015F38A56|nr:4-hydroxy-tetrahydrodipicolinate reductase [Schaalia sp. JY-X169]